MPLVSLIDDHVRAPGGYETFRIIAFDPTQDLLLYAALHEGCPTDPAYSTAFRRYIRSPTRHLPPLPQDYRCEDLAVYHRGRRITHSFRRLSSPPHPISTASQLRIGECILNLDPIPPHSQIDESTFNASHHWLLSNPLAHLRGQLNLPGGQFTLSNILAARDHRFGPHLPKINKLIDGIAFFQDSALFFLATPTTSWMLHANRDGIQLLDQPVTIQNASPLKISLGDIATLTGPRILQRSRTRQTLLFDAAPHAFCEITYPYRLSCPLFNLFAPRPQPGPPVVWQAPAQTPAIDKSSPSHP